MIAKRYGFKFHTSIKLWGEAHRSPSPYSSCSPFFSRALPSFLASLVISGASCPRFDHSQGYGVGKPCFDIFYYVHWCFYLAKVAPCSNVLPINTPRYFIPRQRSSSICSVWKYKVTVWSHTANVEPCVQYGLKTSSLATTVTTTMTFSPGWTWTNCFSIHQKLNFFSLAQNNSVSNFLI